MLNPRIIPLLLVGIALPVLGCGGPKSPGDVAKAATYASRDADVDKLERLMAPADFRTMLQAVGGDRKKLAQIMQRSQEQAQVKEVRVLSTQIDGDSATVEVEMVTAKGRVRAPTHLRKIRGEWRVTSPPASGGARRGGR